MVRIKHGMPGIYNATPLTLSDGEGSGLAVDANGRLILPGAATSGAAAPTTTDIVGGVYNTSAPTYTNGQATQNQADTNGKLVVSPYAASGSFVSGAITSAMTGTTSTLLLAAPAAGLRNYITNIVVSNAHATVGTDVVIQDGNSGTTLYTIPAAAVYGGASVSFPVPLRQSTTATALYVANVTTGASTKASASGYTAA